jgi:zinc protease
MRLLLAAAAASALGACVTTPRATTGLLEGIVPVSTLAPPGDLGFDGLTFPTKQLRLGSGMRVAIEKAPTRGIVAIVLTVGAGASNDPTGKEGIAHFTEHLVFRSRPVKDGPTIGDRMALLADAVRNAHTDTDLTTFESAVPKQALPAALDTLATMFAHPVDNVDEETVATEREIVESEYLLRDETGASGQIAAWLHEALFAPNHPYARSIGGTADSASRLTVEDARAFAREHYRPDNASLVLVGDFDEDDVGRIIAAMPAAFVGEGKAKEPARMPFVPLPPLPPPAPPSGAYEHQAAVDRPTVLVAWRLPNVYGQSGAGVRIVTSPASHAVFKRWLQQDPDVVSASFHVRPYRQATIVYWRVELANPRRRQAIARAVADGFEQVWEPLSKRDATAIAERQGRWSEDVQREELLAIASMRQQTAASAVFGAESYWDRAVDRARFLHLMGDGSTYVKTIGAVVDASMEDVASFAARNLADGRARFIYLTPLPTDQRPRPALPGPDRRDVGKVADRPFAAPKFGTPPRAASPAELTRMRVFRLSNGLEVALVPRNGFPVVTVALGYHGGAAASRPPGAGTLLRFVESRVQARDAFNAVVVESFDEPDLSVEVARAGKRNLPNALMLLATKLKVGDDAQWDRLLAKQPSEDGERSTAHAAAQRESASWRAGQALARAMYGNDGYGRVVSRQDLEAVTGEEMRAWVRQARSPRNVTLVIAGDIDVEEARNLVQQWFGGWEALRGEQETAAPPTPSPSPGPARETVLVFDEPGSTQTRLDVACRLPNGGAREAGTYNLLAGVVGGFLRTRIREEAGAAYAVSATPRVLRGGAAHLQISLSVDNARLRDVLRILRGHWRAFGEGQFDEGALSQVKWWSGVGAGFRFQTSSELAMLVLDAMNHGWPADQAARAVDDAMAATPADLAKAFEVCRATTVLAFVGDAAAINAAGVTPTAP